MGALPIRELDGNPRVRSFLEVVLGCCIKKQLLTSRSSYY